MRVISSKIVLTVGKRLWKLLQWSSSLIMNTWIRNCISPTIAYPGVTLSFWDGPQFVYGVFFSLNKCTSYLSLCLSLNSFCDETPRTWASLSPETWCVILVTRSWTQVPACILAELESQHVSSSPNLVGVPVHTVSLPGLHLWTQLTLFNKCLPAPTVFQELF